MDKQLDFGFDKLSPNIKKLKRFTSFNNFNMIQCGDYNWRVEKEYPDEGYEEEVYIFMFDTKDSIINVIHRKNLLKISTLNTKYTGEGNSFVFKIDFENTSDFLKSFIEGEQGNVGPLYSKGQEIIK